jgi:hypothetical protein
MIGYSSRQEVFMLGNFLATALYFFAGLFLALAAWTKTTYAPSWLLWLSALAFLIVGFWRLLHLSKGR